MGTCYPTVETANENYLRYPHALAILHAHVDLVKTRGTYVFGRDFSIRIILRKRNAQKEQPFANQPQPQHRKRVPSNFGWISIGRRSLKIWHAASRFRTENSVIVSLCNTSHTLQCTKRRRRIPSLLETCTLCIATVFPRRAKGWCSFYPSREIEKKKWKITITRNRHALESRTR